MNVVFKGIQYNAGVWRPAIGRVADVISYDTETTVEKDPSAVLAYVIGTVCDGKSVYFIRRQDLTAFWTVHSNCTVYFHTASFDLEVTTAACGHDFLPMIEVGLVRDISIYYRLLQCAKNGNIPQRFSLGLMCSELLGVELDKNETIRKGFGQFYHAGVINYKAVPTAYLEYATRDAIATFGLAECLEAECRVVHTQHTPLLQVGIAGTVGRSALSGRPGDVSDPQCRIEDANRPPLRHNGTYGTNGITALPWGLLGHDIQLRGDIALRAIERYGIRVDTPAVEALDQRLTAESGRHHAVLASFGYVPGKAGNQAVFNQVISQIEAERGVVIPVTPNSRKKSQAEDDLKPLADHPFVDAFLRTKDVDKIRKTYLDKLRTPDERVRPRYTLLVRTGRTSCSSPNIQNQPRDGGIRECLIPAPGHVLIACDYSMLELCTLAQLTYQRYGHSAMRELINQGVDLHRHVASMVLRKPADAVTKPERQKAKFRRGRIHQFLWPCSHTVKCE